MSISLILMFLYAYSLYDFHKSHMSNYSANYKIFPCSSRASETSVESKYKKYFILAIYGLDTKP